MVPTSHFDVRKAKKDKENKPEKAPKATKRGHYTDDLMVWHRGKPGPIYNTELPWVSEKEKKRCATIKFPKKSTFIDAMFRVPKEKRNPGPGAYNLLKSDKEIEADKLKMKSK